MNETDCEKNFQICGDRTAFKQQGELLARWIWVLPWLFMFQTAGLLVQVVIDEEIRLAGGILNLVGTVVYGGILLRISSEERAYSVAGVLTLVTAAPGLIAIVTTQIYIPDMEVAIVVMISAVLAIIEYKYEFSAHAAVLEGVGNKLGRKWRKLWKRMSHGLVTIGVGILLLVAVFGGLVIMVGVIMILSTIILKPVYLFRTAQAFQDVAVG